MPGFEMDYMPVDTVQESAAVTDMMGDASVANHAAAQGRFWNEPTKCLIFMWVIVVAAYFAVATFFRNYRY
jgi:hypothetical protein